MSSKGQRKGKRQPKPRPKQTAPVVQPKTPHPVRTTLKVLSGLLVAARIGSVNGDTGTSYEMDAIGSCFIGGASAYGGVGTVPGVIIGAVLMGVINLGMSVMGIDQNFQKVVKGAVLLAAVIFDVVSKQNESK